MDPRSSSMLTITGSVISGGTFTQVNDNRQTIQLQGTGKNGFDLLKEAVSPNAFHNSNARLDPPRCHENTRVEVISRILDWVSREDLESSNPQIMWLHGAAGAGKSAISQTIADRCSSDGQLLASFFFGGSDSSRNQAKFIFSTIGYQIALALPEARDKLIETIERDPLVFSRSLSTQFESFIIDPLSIQISDTEFPNGTSFPRLIVIDALDECLERRSQSDILEAIFRGIRDRHLPPLRFLISSRSEHEISIKFSSPNLAGNLTELVLDETYFPERDIEFYLEAKFKEITETHPFRRYIPLHWPTRDNIKYLARKSSGQFIYASTVIKYGGSSRHRPHHRLEVILNIRPPQGDHPLSELDTLYKHIFSSAIEVNQILLIVSFYLLENFAGPIEVVEDLFFLERGDIEIFFCDLSSIISVSQDEAKEPFRFLHESLHDFLLDKSRSGQFHIDMKSKCNEIIRKCFKFLSFKPFSDASFARAHRLAMTLIMRHFSMAFSDVFEIWDDIVSLSLSRIYVELKNTHSKATLSLISEFNIKFLPWLVELLQNEKLKDVSFAYLRTYEDVLRQHLDVYYASPYLTYLVACIGYSATFTARDWLFRRFQSVNELGALVQSDIDNRRLTLLYVNAPEDDSDPDGYLKLLREFLLDSSMSGAYTLTGERYATAAVLLLYYICDNHRALCSVVETYIPNLPWLHVFDPLGAVDQAAFFVSQADKSDALISLCRRGNFGTLARMSYPYYKKLWGATNEYLNKVDT
ncbi:hypothetical protein CPB84DRAFT_1772544 [Gymnopilus junonius]|uniref:Nephrocystin 3-like N-terminal domain-containing protein n=1 Tax=Gymnopilus junonius TaxID=109634 RepID=A0A9P5NU27_GYMJU|nr:hypothetical protein CPB84DRAFT_1772544 [Gymnopilus junonius]